MARKKKTMDGNTAASHVAYAFTEVAGIYPITPSSVMAEMADEWAANGLKNIFGQTVKVMEMQSEAGAAGTVHGSLAAGALTTTFTASQGLLLMIPNMYKIAGELLPGVIHVSARTLATHALSIFGDHSDVMACRQTGFAMMCATNPQEVMDLGAVAHLSAIKGRVPFLNFFDGFRTSHEVQKIEAWDYDELKEMIDMDAVQAFRDRALNPDHPVLRGTAQNPDIFFQAREACNPYYDAITDIVINYMDEVNKKAGTNYKPFNYYGAPDAEKIIIAMGSVCDTIEETVDYLNSKGEKTGLVKVRLYRPFNRDLLIDAIPDKVKKIAVLDRTKEPGALGEPLYLDVVTALTGSKFANIPVAGGRYGLGSKDTTPANIISVYENLKKEFPQGNFTIGIEDDVTNLSLPMGENPDTTPAGTVSCKFWGLGSDGTVGANKDAIKIIGDHTDKYAQAYFAYDSKKSGGVTISHLRFGDKPIRSTYYVSKADYVACHNPSYVDKYDITKDLKDGGTFVLNCAWDLADCENRLPAKIKRDLANKKAKFYTIDGIGIARSINKRGLGMNMILQTVFFKLANIIPIDDAVKFLKDAVVKSYGSKGEEVVNMNYKCIDEGLVNVKEIKVPAEWANAVEDITAKEIAGRPEITDFIRDILNPVNAQKGDDLPVSIFKDADGTFPQGSAAYEKRGIAVDVPCWVSENCIQCNFCSYVCPHAVIRPLAIPENDEVPANLDTIAMTGVPGYKFAMTVSTLDCTGCGSCANVCPGRKGEKALVMKPIDSQMDKKDNIELAYKYTDDETVLAKFKPESVKGSQFKQPLFEFSGACAGCGETPYAKLVTQLFGDRMYIANATGCSSIWGGSAPATPYTLNKDGKGPTWANSLFEDNAEYGLGMALAVAQRRDKAAELVKQLIAIDYAEADIKEAGQKWLDTMNDGNLSKVSSAALIAVLEDGIDMEGIVWEGKTYTKDDVCPCDACTLARQLLAMKDVFIKKSFWIFGGDGWAYDIGFGGLDHSIAMGLDINIFVFDTEVYSNTGGQASKATPTGSVAQFAAAGKGQKKKDLAGIAMSYGYVYVAQIAMGADFNQCIKAIVEAENYDGPSVVIGYSTCINHGIKLGMGNSMAEEKLAVAAGYWHLFRFNPTLFTAGQNPFSLDSKEPTGSFMEFIKTENRYSSLTRKFPERAKKLFENAEIDAKLKYSRLTKLVDYYNI
ncbi:MAG: pyruvate:ferredoxin (flavodoxin) oxidoreductase [Oscillospiraceae bacterium]|nr:pyruvate:ferredoxin (flavodoxin) oxidoreductase [Oscillospiraceae bacterium]